MSRLGVTPPGEKVSLQKVSGGRVADLAHVLSLLPLAGAGGFAVVLALNIRRLTAVFTWNPDFVSPMVMAERLGTAHGPGEVVFGTYAPITTLWFNVVTRHLPAHRALWKLAPLIVTVLGLAALGWAVWRVAGRWPAMVTVAVGFSGSTPILTTFLPQANHGPAYFVMCLLAAFLVFISTRRVTPFVIGSAALLGIVSGLNVAADPLLLLVGIGPFFGAALFLGFRRRLGDERHVVTIAAGVTALSVVVAMGANRVIRAAGYGVLGVAEHDDPLAAASPSEIWANLRQLVENFGKVFNAEFAATVDLATPVRVLLAAVALAGLGATVRVLIRSLLAKAPSSGQTASDRVALDLLQLYWGLIAGGLLVGLVFSRLATDNAPRSVSYMTPVFLAVAVIGPLVARRSREWRAVAGVGAALFCVLSIVSVAQQDIPKLYLPFDYVVDGDELLRVLEAKGLDRGFSSYGSASPLTFRSGGRVHVAPVNVCAVAPERVSMCGFLANRVKSWYEPRPGRSFVISDVTQYWAVPSPPPAELGVPSEVLVVGSQTVFVYPYDVATRFGPTG